MATGKPTENTPPQEHSASCQPKTQNQLLEEYSRRILSMPGFTDSHFMLPDLADQIRPYLEQTAGARTHLTGNQEQCLPSDNPDAPLNERSTCPWHFVENFENAR